MNRKSFQHLPGEENPQFLEDGNQIYQMLKDRYGIKDVVALDNILNGLCASLVCLTRECVDKDNHRSFLQLIHKILSENLN